MQLPPLLPTTRATLRLPAPGFAAEGPAAAADAPPPVGRTAADADAGRRVPAAPLRGAGADTVLGGGIFPCAPGRREAVPGGTWPTWNVGPLGGGMAPAAACCAVPVLFPAATAVCTAPGADALVLRPSPEASAAMLGPASPLPASVMTLRRAPPLAPVSQPDTLAAKRREHRLSPADAGSGLMLTNMRVLPLPPRQG